MTARRKPIHLAAHFPGVNSTTIWNRPKSGSQIDVASFVHLAQAAERGRFDFFFLAEGLRLREHRGEIFELDVVGRPDSLTVLAALASVTTHIGLAATLNTTFNEPYELARQFASLDHLSKGRAGWNAVTSPDAYTGENFRRGGFLDHDLRYQRAAELIETVRALWDGHEVVHRGEQFSISGRLDVPRSPQGYPVQIQAGDSDEGRDLAARYAEVIFSRHASLRAGQRFYADIARRVAAAGRPAGSLKIIPAATAVVGDSDADAQEKARAIHLDQISPQGAIAFVEQVWGRDLSHLDPDGPLPPDDPDVEGVASTTRGRVRHVKDPVATAQQWRELAAATSLSIRELVIQVTARATFVGTPSTIAEQIDHAVQSDAADGYILVPHLTPHGLDEFIDRVVPELRDRGAFRSEYEHDTLRGHLGLPAVPRPPRDRSDHG